MPEVNTSIETDFDFFLPAQTKLAKLQITAVACTDFLKGWGEKKRKRTHTVGPCH